MRSLVLALAVLACLPLAFATHEGPSCQPFTSEPDVDFTAYGQPYYLDNDDDTDATFSIWLYEESNGVDGLQRFDLSVDGTCGHPELSDTVLF